MTSATFYVYIHIRLDNNQVFYVGKGRGKRAGRRTGRNKHWKNIVAKYGFKSKIVQSEMLEVEAFKLESALIFYYKYMGLKLANLTDGGEGVSGLVVTDERKAYLSEINSGRNNPFYGKKFTEEHKRNISLSKQGENHHLYDNKIRIFHHREKGFEFCTRYEMMSKHGLTTSDMSRLINGKQRKAKGWMIT